MEIRISIERIMHYKGSPLQDKALIQFVYDDNLLSQENSNSRTEGSWL